jgi:hypothetical protein
MFAQNHFIRFYKTTAHVLPKNFFFFVEKEKNIYLVCTIGETDPKKQKNGGKKYK